MNTVVQGPLTITPKSASNCDNIYKLAQFCVKKTPVAVTTDLCARVALMVSIFFLPSITSLCLKSHSASPTYTIPATIIGIRSTLI
jgi:hypothetical protein